MRILDTHLHLIYPDRFSYPWLEGFDAINKPWRVEDYFQEALALGIESALHMEVDAAERDMFAESEFMASIHPRVAGVIAACRPEKEDFERQLEMFTQIPNIRGLRRVLHQSPDELSQTEVFRDNLGLLAKHGLSFDLCLRGDQLALARPLVDAAPDTQFILDHCGVPDMTTENFATWQADISELAKRPNVAGKISGIIAYGGPDWSIQSLKPTFEHMIDSFGWNRVVWGSDHPVCTLTASLTQWVKTTHSLLTGASETEIASLLHRNAERIYLS